MEIAGDFVGDDSVQCRSEGVGGIDSVVAVEVVGGETVGDDRTAEKKTALSLKSPRGGHEVGSCRPGRML